MRKYQVVPMYSMLTGEPNGTRQEYIGDYCDFCGEFSDEVNDPTFSVNNSGDTEESWYYHESPIIEAAGGDIHKVFTEHSKYFYCCDYGPYPTQLCSKDMLANKSDSLESIMELSRIKVVEDLLKSGVTVEELDINADI